MFAHPRFWLSKSRPGRRARPAVEPQEDRTLLAVAPLPLVAEKEPNDAQPLATRVPLNTAAAGAIGRPGDVDYFAIDVAEPGALIASLERPAGSALDGQVSLEEVNSYLILDGQPAGG